MTKKIVAVVGEYTNQQGEQKAEFCDIGIINVSQNGKEYALLDPAISLSGVLAKQNALAAKRGEEPRNMIMCSLFERQQNQPQQGAHGQQQGGYGQNNGYQAPQQNYQQPQQQAPQNYQQPQRQPHQQSNQAPNRSVPAQGMDSFDDD